MFVITTCNSKFYKKDVYKMLLHWAQKWKSLIFYWFSLLFVFLNKFVIVAKNRIFCCCICNMNSRWLSLAKRLSSSSSSLSRSSVWADSRRIFIPSSTRASAWEDFPLLFKVGSHPSASFRFFVSLKLSVAYFLMSSAFFFSSSAFLFSLSLAVSQISFASSIRLCISVKPR